MVVVWIFVLGSLLSFFLHISRLRSNYMRGSRIAAATAACYSLFLEQHTSCVKIKLTFLCSHMWCSFWLYECICLRKYQNNKENSKHKKTVHMCFTIHIHTHIHTSYVWMTIDKSLLSILMVCLCFSWLFFCCYICLLPRRRRFIAFTHTNKCVMSVHFVTNTKVCDCHVVLEKLNIFFYIKDPIKAPMS